MTFVYENKFEVCVNIFFGWREDVDGMASKPDLCVNELWLFLCSYPSHTLILSYSIRSSHKHIFSYLTGKGWEGMAWHQCNVSTLEMPRMATLDTRRKVGTIHSFRFTTADIASEATLALRPRPEPRPERPVDSSRQTRAELRMPEQWLRLHYTLTGANNNFT